MKINEVEALVGITKKNIRFYEEQGLRSPKRNSENSNREYGDEEVQTLRRIKILRKLAVPIEEIQLMFNGTHTVADCMRRHLISLELGMIISVWILLKSRLNEIEGGEDAPTQY